MAITVNWDDKYNELQINTDENEEKKIDDTKSQRSVIKNK